VTDSPELGPPPVAHFDDADPIKHDPTAQIAVDQSPSKTLITSDSISDFDATRFFANLETRKRRRETTFSRNTNDGTNTDCETEKPGSVNSTRSLSEQPIKQGAKRKLSSRDEDEAVDHPLPEKNRDDSRFNRRIDTQDSSTQQQNSRGAVSVTGGKASGHTEAIVKPLAGARDRAKSSVISDATSFRKALGESECMTP
jgi:hypothetical protein